MLKKGDIVRSTEHNEKIIPYLIVLSDVNGYAVCINLIDTYRYTIPVHHLYLWIVE